MGSNIEELPDPPEPNICPTDNIPSLSGFAFSIQSQDSLTSRWLPQGDHHPRPRQRRKRTSPEDQAILEAEYLRNSKPDKATRIEIVNRVSLGEKEVQIWFQNRRQMTRRKSRPLLPEEIMANLSSNHDTTYLPTSSSDNSGASQRPLSSNQSEPSLSQSSIPEKDSSTGILVEGSPIGTEVIAISDSKTDGRVCASIPTLGTSLENANDVVDAGVAQSCTEIGRSTNDLEGQSMIKVLSQPPFLPTTMGVGYLSNRKSAQFALQKEKPQREEQQLSSLTASILGLNRSSNEVSAPLPPLRRNPSTVKLSLSLDGKAEVTANTGNTPSPPRSQPLPASTFPRRPMALQRSRSAASPAISIAEDQDISSVPLPKHSMLGRSKDARTWEFYCDSDVRNALTAQAEQEQNGSAVGAIGLMRSRSNRAMPPNSNKRNAQAHKHESTKRIKAVDMKGQKPKLARATSSLARLQTVGGEVSTVLGASDEKTSKPNSLLEEVYDGADSDKENWEPGTQSRTIRRRPHPSPRASSCVGRSVLREAQNIPSQSSSLHVLMDRENNTFRRPLMTTPSMDLENEKPNDGEEVASLAGEEKLPREEDLDCVQNLLSLSQGAWR